MVRVCAASLDRRTVAGGTADRALPSFSQRIGRRAARERTFDRYEVTFLRAEDMEEIARIPGRNFTSDDLRRRLDEGQRCLGMKYEGRIAAFTWCDFTFCLFEQNRLFPLRDDEACLFDAYTLEAFRGHDLAPFMRLAVTRSWRKSAARAASV